MGGPNHNNNIIVVACDLPFYTWEERWWWWGFQECRAGWTECNRPLRSRAGQANSLRRDSRTRRRRWPTRSSATDAARCCPCRRRRLGGGGGGAHSLAECSISGRRRRCGARGCWHSTNAATPPDEMCESVAGRAIAPAAGARSRPACCDSLSQPAASFACAAAKLAVRCSPCTHKVTGRFMHFRFPCFQRKI